VLAKHNPVSRPPCSPPGPPSRSPTWPRWRRSRWNLSLVSTGAAR